MDVRSVYENKTNAAFKEQIDVEVQEANAVSLDWRKEAKFVSLLSDIIDERLWGHLLLTWTK